MQSSLIIPITAIALLHLVLLVLAYVYQSTDRQQLQWVFFTIALSLLTTVLHLLPDEIQVLDKFGRGFFIFIALALTLIAYGGMILYDILRHQSYPRILKAWGIFCGVWLAAFFVAALLGEAVVIGQPDWVNESIGLPGILLLSGFVFSGLLLLAFTLYDFYVANQPEIANRSIFWTIITAVFLLGHVLVGSSHPTFSVAGLNIFLLVMVSIIYAYTHHRVLDVRTSMILGLRTFMVMLVMWLVIFSAIYLTNRIGINVDLAGTLIIAGIALVFAAIIIPLRQTIVVIFHNLLSRSRSSMASATAMYSRNIAEATNLDEVVTVTTNTLNTVLRVHRSALILVSNATRVPDAIELVVLSDKTSSTDKIEKQVTHVAHASSVYDTLAMKKKPLPQFDIDFGAQYQNIPDAERTFFTQLGMSVYAPVVAEKHLIGLLACGAKVNDTSFDDFDFELLMVIGQQVGTAIRSARLIDDLRHLNTSMRSLNQQLQVAKQELEKLDSIKTDFVTIASHELRTPLAQMRGYTDMIDGLSEQGLLDNAQIMKMVSNQRRATERMEELITAMLDVSQIDVNALDLRFVQTTAETIVRMAIEPLTDVIKQRRLVLEARGLEGLPSIHADMQRLVQAFWNIVVNAIKFTPDGGKITVEASAQDNTSSEGLDHILFSIADSGVGIEKKDQELIFQKFYRGFDPQLHSTGTYKFMGAGPGLGMTIAKGIIEGHGGKLWAESPGYDVDKLPGATFYISLPVTPPQDAKRVMPFESPDSAKQDGNQPSTTKLPSVPVEGKSEVVTENANLEEKKETTKDTDEAKPDPAARKNQTADES